MPRVSSFAHNFLDDAAGVHEVPAHDRHRSALRMESSPLVEEFGGWLRMHRGAVPGLIANYARVAQSMVQALGEPR
jgi:hypothetical protein